MADVITVYRVGIGRDLNTLRGYIRRRRWRQARRASLRLLARCRRRKWWCFWQAEPTDETVDLWPRAVRGLTRAGCERRALREYRRRLAHG